MAMVTNFKHGIRFSSAKTVPPFAFIGIKAEIFRHQQKPKKKLDSYIEMKKKM